jgi:integration host factor subunit alpha
MGEKTLTRADLAEAIVRKVGLPRNESQDLVELVLNEISVSLAAGDTVKLSSFGSFGIRSKGQRVGNIMKDRINAGLSRRKAAE